MLYFGANNDYDGVIPYYYEKLMCKELFFNFNFCLPKAHNTTTFCLAQYNNWAF
jgi:hypothetical protein